MAAPHPPPKGKAPISKLSKPSQQGLSFSEQLAKRELTKVQTVVTDLNLKDIKLVLITSKEANDARLQFIEDPNNKRAAECRRAFVQVVVPAEVDGIGDSYAGNEVEVLAFELHKKYRFTHVICHTENDLIRTARIRKMLGITTGQSLQNVLRYRDKVLMKEVCAQAGLTVPICAPVEGASDVLQFVSTHGYPVVVKPRLGYSSVDTTVLRSYEDAVIFCKKGLSQPGLDPIYGLEIEKFVNGPMFHIDGLVFEGKVVFSWPSKYVGTVMQYKTNPYIAGYSLAHSEPLAERLNRYIEDVIKALGAAPHPNPPTFPFHAEAWLTPQDEIVLCEIASRGGGGNIKKEVTELFGLNMDEIWTQASCGDACVTILTSFSFTSQSLPTQFEDDLDRFKTWHHWKPRVNYHVGWIYIYPKNGTVTNIPKYDNATSTFDLLMSMADHVEQWTPPLPEFCLQLQTWLSEGQSFQGPTDCADTVCAALVKGETEADVLQSIQGICDWFFLHTTWN